MTDRSAALAFASQLPRYDPLGDPRQRSRRWLTGLASAGLHLLVLALLWDAILGAVIEPDEVLEVQLIEPEPEQSKPQMRPKVLAQRVLDATVRRYSPTAQPRIIEKSDIRRLDSAEKVEIKQIQAVEAPKEIAPTEVVAQRVSIFSDRPVSQPLDIPRTTSASVAKVESALGSAGPRKLEAAGPNANPQAARVTAPSVARGVISDTAVEGDVTGVKVADVPVGDGNALLEGASRQGALVTGSKDCSKDPVCLAYLEMMRKRVYERWFVPGDLSNGVVRLSFRLDRGGSAHEVNVESASAPRLGDTAALAFQHSSPFPPPPQSIYYIVNKRVTLTFTYRIGETLGRR
jgi:TonB family protein